MALRVLVLRSKATSPFNSLSMFEGSYLPALDFFRAPKSRRFAMHEPVHGFEHCGRSLACIFLLRGLCAPVHLFVFGMFVFDDAGSIFSGGPERAIRRWPACRGPQTRSFYRPSVGRTTIDCKQRIRLFGGFERPFRQRTSTPPLT